MENNIPNFQEYLRGLTPADRLLLAQELALSEKEDKATILSNVRQDVVNLVENNGLTLEDVFPDCDIKKVFGSLLKSKTAKSPAKYEPKHEPKYRNPENALETWSGLGKAPAWVKAFDQKGIHRDTYLISELDKEYQIPGTASENADGVNDTQNQ